MVSLPSSSTSSSTGQLSEDFIQNSFHSYLKSSLTQAKSERLLDEDLLSSAEGDLMITGPALCLYFAALRSTTNPPSVPLPRSKDSSKTPMDLSYDNCPPAFISFLKVWAKNVPSIQGLTPEYQHDLARIICGLEPLAQPINVSINGIAADLRAVAIEISQRRSFQNRYASALQAALDSGSGSGKSPRRASFVPPPSYDTPPSPSPSHSSFMASTSGSSGRASLEIPPPVPPRNRPSSISTHLIPPPSASPSMTSFPHSPSPTILAFDSPAIEFIRETLYASLADQLELMPSLRKLLSRDPTRAYYASVAFAILDVSTRAITPEGEVEGVLGKRLALSECPPPLQPFFRELVGIGHQAKLVEEEDNENAIKLVSKGKAPPAARMERVKRMLECGVGVEREAGDNPRASVEGRAVEFSNRINGLALSLTKLKAFRDRQDQVFKVLAGVGVS
ncbi:hypothetical protein FA15DRAFT_676442 [Coprinopsis marcescibilis]|uniref:Uncharacterized protein n=1 Tax=Coprinopsis marcescibilis TaxID=230819 RepID=A0A5C3KA33_COPMA|nr:hypothetical protein FA15DRAFT_676442 [Coprinopsis marcescibilis]